MAMDGAFFLFTKVVTSRGDNKKHSVNVAARSATRSATSLSGSLWPLQPPNSHQSMNMYG